MNRLAIDLREAYRDKDLTHGNREVFYTPYNELDNTMVEIGHFDKVKAKTEKNASKKMLQTKGGRMRLEVFHLSISPQIFQIGLAMKLVLSTSLHIYRKESLCMTTETMKGKRYS